MIDSYYAPIAYKVVHKDGLKLVGKEQIKEREFFKAEDIINMMQGYLRSFDIMNDEEETLCYYDKEITVFKFILKQLKE